MSSFFILNWCWSATLDFMYSSDGYFANKRTKWTKQMNKSIFVNGNLNFSWFKFTVMYPETLYFNLVVNLVNCGNKNVLWVWWNVAHNEVFIHNVTVMYSKSHRWCAGLYVYVLEKLSVSYSKEPSEIWRVTTPTYCIFNILKSHKGMHGF